MVQGSATGPILRTRCPNREVLGQVSMVPGEAPWLPPASLQVASNQVGWARSPLSISPGQEQVVLTPVPWTLHGSASARLAELSPGCHILLTVIAESQRLQFLDLDSDSGSPNCVCAIHTHMHTHVHTCTPTHAHPCAHVHICTSAHPHTCTPARAHPTHVHTCAHSAHMHTSRAHTHSSHTCTCMSCLGARAPCLC